MADEDARKLFEQRRDKLGTPEKRELSQIVFPNVEEATAARNRILSGLSFDDLAKERGLGASDVELGMVTKSEIIDPLISAAAFSLPSGEISQPVQGKFGVVLVKVGNHEVAEDVVQEAEQGRLVVVRAKDALEHEVGLGVAEYGSWSHGEILHPRQPRGEGPWHGSCPRWRP